jgi:hypothetical protein
MTWTISTLTTAGSTSIVLPMLVLFWIILILKKKSDLFSNLD